MNRNMIFVLLGLFLIVLPMIATNFMYHAPPVADRPAPTEMQRTAGRIVRDAIYFQIAGALLIAFGYRKRITKVARKIS